VDVGTRYNVPVSDAIRNRTDAELRAAEYGVDLSLIDAALARTPTERVIAHERALELMTALRRSGETFREEPPAASSSPR
jgi:hypothetical protein